MPARGATQGVFWNRFEASWDRIEPIRSFVTSYVRQRLGDEAADNAALAVGELLENAVKYGDLMGEVEVEMACDEPTRTIEIKVSNHARQARIRVLRREFERCQDGAGQAFKNAMLRLSKLPPGMTMLGLSRIAEVASLALEVDGSRVTLVATMGTGSRSSTTGVRRLKASVAR